MRGTKLIILFIALIGGVCEWSIAEEGELPKSKGIGPVKELKIEPLDSKLANEGKALFTMKCSACHKTTADRLVGPGLKDVTKRRMSEWVMNMILNPQEMIEKDPEAQKLFEVYLVPMTFQNVTQIEARKILEYFRLNDEGVGIEDSKVKALDKKNEKKSQGTTQSKSENRK